MNDTLEEALKAALVAASQSVMRSVNARSRRAQLKNTKEAMDAILAALNLLDPPTSTTQAL